GRRGPPGRLPAPAPALRAPCARAGGAPPARSLLDIAGAPADPASASFSEYHAVGAPAGAFMLRKDRWKYHEDVGYPCELFDLAADPDERIDRADDPACHAAVAAMRSELRRFVDPVAADRQAKADQRDLIARFGGREQAFRIGTKGATPAPV